MVVVDYNDVAFATAVLVAVFDVEVVVGVVDGIVDDALFRSVLSNRTEAEANRLAANILMP